MKTFSSWMLLFFSLCTAGFLNAQNLPGSTCDTAIPMAVNSSVSGSNIGILSDASSVGAVCGSNLGSSGQMWYVFSVETDSEVTVATCGTGTTYDTRLNIYSGVCGSLSCVAFNDDACGFKSSITMVAAAGTQYLVRVGAFSIDNGQFELTIIGSDYQGGCTDPAAVNFDPNALNDDGSCQYTGCTDTFATNYNPSATNDDGSCEYCNGPNSVSVSLYLCTFSNGAAVSLSITDESGNLVFQSPVMGNVAIQYFTLCLDASECYSATMTNTFGETGWYNGYFWINSFDGQAINESLDPTLTTETVIFSIDGSCSTVVGCTDPEATNYDPNATVDSGYCQYPLVCEGGNAIMMNMVTGAFAQECSFHILDANGNLVYQSQPFSASNTNNFIELCLADGCYSVILYDSFGDGWNGGYLEVYYNGTATQFSLQNGDLGVNVFPLNTTEICSPNVSAGCTDPGASNYDPAAVYDNGSCQYMGCTDPNAMNFSGMANVDDGSCQYCNGIGSVNAQFYICTFNNGNEVEVEITDDAGNLVYFLAGLGNNAIYNEDLCLSAGVCYTVTMINNAGPNGWYNGYFWINVGGAQVIYAEPNANAQSQTVQFSVDGTCSPLYGCTDPAALNYDENAQMDNGTCQYPLSGCTDPAALNYNAAATVDDNSCLYPESCDDNMLIVTLSPGIFVNEASYEIVDANGMLILSGSGANTNYACVGDGCYVLNMFDTFGDGWDGGGYLNISLNGVISTYVLAGGLDFDFVGFGINAEGCVPEVYGCTDSSAMNYNQAATADDGSCVYFEDCTENGVYIQLTTQLWGNEVSWSLVAADGSVVASGSGYSSWNSYAQFVCLADGCYEMHLHDSWGDGWNGAYFQITGNGIYDEGTLMYGNDVTQIISINSDCNVVEGCMDPDAMNYNPAATFDNGSCVYNNVNGGNVPVVNNGLEIEYNLYPNPTNSGISVNLNNLQTDAPIQISISSLDGKLVNAYTFGNNEKNRLIQLNVEELSAGYYFVKVDNGSRSSTLPLIKH
jgi:hypothetical protein